MFSLHKYGISNVIGINFSLIVHFLTLRYIWVMYERKIPLNLNCGLDLIGEVLYGKWKIRLLWFIKEGYKRPSELQRKIPNASRRVLSMQLKELENHGLIARKIFAVIPPKVEYSLTAFGDTLIPIIAALGNWGDEHEVQLKQVIQKRMDQ